jgi:AraC-like DNA-binding protein
MNTTKTLVELRTLIARHSRSGQASTAIPGIWALASDVPTEPIHQVYEPIFAVVAQGVKRTIVGNKILDCGAGAYLVVSVDLPVTAHILRATAAEKFLATGLTLKPAAIASLLLEMGLNDRSAVEPSGMGVGDATDDLLEPVVRLLRLLDRPQDVAVLQPMIEREILWRLFAGELGSTVRQIGLADSRLSQINRVVRWIRDHYAEALRIEDLAQLAAMSVSSLHRHFRAVTAMSPLQYQKQIRLQEARARLLTDSEDVAAVGLSVGYGSPSQFSREYCRLFGFPPGRDAARQRSGS